MKTCEIESLEVILDLRPNVVTINKTLVNSILTNFSDSYHIRQKLGNEILYLSTEDKNESMIISPSLIRLIQFKKIVGENIENSFFMLSNILNINDKENHNFSIKLKIKKHIDIINEQNIQHVINFSKLLNPNYFKDKTYEPDSFLLLNIEVVLKELNSSIPIQISVIPDGYLLIATFNEKGIFDLRLKINEIRDVQFIRVCNLLNGLNIS